VSGDNWSYRSCKAPVIITTNKATKTTKYYSTDIHKLLWKGGDEPRKKPLEVGGIRITLRYG